MHNNESVWVQTCIDSYIEILRIVVATGGISIKLFNSSAVETVFIALVIWSKPTRAQSGKDMSYQNPINTNKIVILDACLFLVVWVYVTTKNSIE